MTPTDGIKSNLSIGTTPLFGGSPKKEGLSDSAKAAKELNGFGVGQTDYNMGLSVQKTTPAAQAVTPAIARWNDTSNISPITRKTAEKSGSEFVNRFDPNTSPDIAKGHIAKAFA